MSKERPLKMIGESKKILVERPIEPDFKSSSWGERCLPSSFKLKLPQK